MTSEEYRERAPDTQNDWGEDTPALRRSLLAHAVCLSKRIARWQATSFPRLFPSVFSPRLVHRNLSMTFVREYVFLAREAGLSSLDFWVLLASKTKRI